MADSSSSGNEPCDYALTLWLVSIVLVSAKERADQDRTSERETGSLLVLAFRELHGLPQQPCDAGWRGRVDRRDLALDDDGQLGARSVLAGGRAARDDRSPHTLRRDPGRVRRLSHAHGDTYRPRVWGQGRSVRSSARPSATQAELRRLAADGVSCSVCHQISKERLGTRESFNGEFVIEPTPDSGVRPIFGPYRVDTGRKTIMRSVSGFAQEEAPHIKQSELCATCHTLITTAFGPNGRGGRIAARADELSGVAAQRLPSRGAKLSVLSHAGSCRARSARPRCSAIHETRWRAMSSSAATPTWFVCLIAIVMSSVSSRCRPSSRRRRTPPSGSCSATPRS